MTKGNVLRIMEKKDLFDVPQVREEFEEYGHHGDYFFFVIEDGNDDNKEVIGYLVAKKEEQKAVITKIELLEKKEKQEEYRNTAISNLYDYVKKIKEAEGKRRFFQVSCM